MKRSILHLTPYLALALADVEESGCLAGPNAGGVLVIHAETVPGFSATDPATCGVSVLESCAGTLARVDGEEPVAFSIFAVFPDGSSPRMAGVVFGIEYGPSIHITSTQGCGHYVLPDPDWPESFSGTAVTWEPASEALIAEIYAFVGYSDADGPGILSTMPHPTQGGLFVEDSIFSELDEIAAFGSLGFGMDGSFTCPEGIGACCFGLWHCKLRTLEDCDRSDGVFHGAGTDCSPNPCNEPTPVIEQSWGEVKALMRGR